MPKTVLRHAICFDVRPSTETDSLVDPASPSGSRADYEEVNIHEGSVENSTAAAPDSNTVLQFLRSVLPDDAQVDLNIDGRTSSISTTRSVITPA